MNNNPLVSIPVITYNSSSYIIEGLESIKAQTYKNIELIISDDCSTDNTVELCRNWLEKNKDYFVRTELVTTNKNTGVAGNCNRAIRACQGVWLKGLSGDDKFLPYTIERYVEYVTNNPQVSIVFAKLHFWGPDKEYVDKVKKMYENKFYPKIKLNQHKQYIEDLKDLFVPGPGLMYKRSLWIEIGGFDENYQFCEEVPFTHNVLKAGYQIYFLNEELYMYTILAESLGRRDNYRQGLTRPQRDVIRYFFDIRRKEMIKSNLILKAWHKTLTYKNILAKNNNQYIKALYYRILKLTSPIFYINVFKFFADKVLYK